MLPGTCDQVVPFPVSVRHGGIILTCPEAIYKGSALSHGSIICLDPGPVPEHLKPGMHIYGYAFFELCILYSNLPKQ